MAESHAMRGSRILIDGRSGSGKSELASALVAEHPRVQLVRLDNLYPGWHGLRAGSEHVLEHVLRADAPRWRRWDWAAGQAAEWHELDPALPILIEGCGALSRANRSRADFAIWVELDEPERRRRALARDGESYEPWWDVWAAQELDFIAAEGPRELADATVAGDHPLDDLGRWGDLFG